MILFYASLKGSSIDYSCGTLYGPWTNEEEAQEFCDMKNSSLADAGIPSAEAYWIIE